ncbi:hypothetical protein [Nocardioides conyzicola]|uniref:Uncharacterized protein n=1 Tax=Nocardioides conyzicola TaxID=1651781 RepID=A0ABP8XKB0_9ACTN
MTEQTTLRPDPVAAAVRFLDTRVQADLTTALADGDDARAAYLRQSLRILDGIRGDLECDRRPAPPELARLTYEWAARYADHPDFDTFWLLLV